MSENPTDMLQFSEVFIWFVTMLSLIAFVYGSVKRRSVGSLEVVKAITLGYLVVFYGALALNYMDAPTSCSAYAGRIGVMALMALMALVCYDSFRPHSR